MQCLVHNKKELVYEESSQLKPRETKNNRNMPKRDQNNGVLPTQRC